MDELYLDNIDEFVNDQDKIVTYKWLSLTLGVHVNTAKQMLYHYLDHKRKESSAQLHATYLVSGKFVDNGLTSHMVSVVKEDKLEDFKSKMSLVVSVHVYSVQKALLKDSGPLYSVDYDAVRDNLKNCSRYSAIRCPGAVPASPLDRQRATEPPQVPTPEPEDKKPAITSSKPSTKPQKGIMGMFASKTTTKNQDGGKDVKEDITPAAAVDAAKTKAAVKAYPMMHFFGSQAANKVVKQKEASPSSSSAEPQSSVPDAAVEPPKDAKKDLPSKTKRVEDSDGEEEKTGKKKRRRIRKPEPDSSDEDVIPDSPWQTETRETSPPNKKLESVSHPHPENSEPKTRKRRRVLKSKTFIDEDGCIVTEKGYESESYSETEDDVQVAKRAPKDVRTKPPASSKPDEKKKKTSTNGNKTTKQASIMGFFQKK